MDEIDAGAEFVRALHGRQPVTAAFWLKASDEGVRYLYVVLTGLADADFGDAYLDVRAVAEALPDHYIDPFRVRLIGPDDPLARAALDVYRRHPRRVPPRFGGSVFGGTPVDELYLYPPPRP